MSERELFIGMWEGELARTLRVMRAYPADKADFKPHERSRSALELEATVLGGARLMAEQVRSAAITGSEIAPAHRGGAKEGAPATDDAPARSGGADEGVATTEDAPARSGGADEGESRRRPTEDVAARSLEEVWKSYEDAHRAFTDAVRAMPDEEWSGNIDFFGTPSRRADTCWMTLLDTIHHRGQLSVYIRLAGGKVPAIYGPSADEETK
ncbi:MAG: DinB family protein [bacterium]|nr:DinB family protein [bacterium]